MTSRTRPLLLVGGILLLIVGVVVIFEVNDDRNQPSVRAEVPKATRTGGPPNVLVVMTDDQTLEQMRILDNVDRWIVDQGTSFTNYFVAFPNCCPSRATYLSGQYPHNHGLRENIAPEGGFHKFNSEEYLPVWLQRSGYWTAHVGKYLNEYGQDGNIAPPKGWNRWYGLIDPSTYRYYGYNVSADGVQEYHGTRPEDYQTDVLGAEVARIIEQRAGAPEPWFVEWMPLAPHATEGEGASGTGLGDQNDNSDGATTIIDRIRDALPVPSPEFQGRMAKEVLPRTAAFNEQDVSKKPPAIQKKFPVGAKLQGVMREGYQRELEALLSVDKWVNRIFDLLQRTEQLANTVVVFTSDNGYFHGEHRLSFSKVWLYEEAVHLPLVIRGGPFPRGAKSPAMAGNVDLAPTILALAGAPKPPLTMDGRDLAKAVADPQKGVGRGMLLENWRENAAKHTDGIRTDRYKYLVSESHDEELYDLQADPAELQNRSGDPAFFTLKAELVRRLNKLRECAGSACEGSDAAGN